MHVCVCVCACFLEESSSHCIQSSWWTKCVSAWDVRRTSVLFDISTTKKSFFCFAGELYCLYEEFANMPRTSVCVFSCLVMLVPNYAGGLLFLVIRMGCVILQDRVSNFYQGGKLLLSCFIYLSEEGFMNVHVWRNVGMNILEGYLLIVSMWYVWWHILKIFLYCTWNISVSKN